MDYQERDTILIGDQLTLKFHTTIGEGEGYQFLSPNNPIIEGVELISSPVTDTLSFKGGSYQLESRVIITSFDSGSYRLPPFSALKIGVDGSVDTLSFEGRELVVETIEIDSENYTPYDVKGQLNFPLTLSEFLPYIGALLFLVAIILLARRVVMRYREKKRVFGRVKPLDPPHIIAIKRVEKLREERRWERDQKEYFTQLTEILREYLEERYSISAMEQTSYEILSQLKREKIERELFGQLSTLFNLSDLVKFAKYRADKEECEGAIPLSISFIKASIPNEQ